MVLPRANDASLVGRVMTAIRLPFRRVDRAPEGFGPECPALTQFSARRERAGATFEVWHNGDQVW